MGVYAIYTAVPQAGILDANDDFELWLEFGFDPPSQFLQCRIQRSWGVLWYLLDPEVRKHENLIRASTILGKAVMGAHIFAEHFCKEFKQEIDNAYYHPRYCTAEEVVRAAAAMKATSQAQLLEAYDAVEVNRNTYSFCTEEQAWHWFKQLSSFYQRAAEKEYAVIVHIG